MAHDFWLLRKIRFLHPWLSYQQEYDYKFDYDTCVSLIMRHDCLEIADLLAEEVNSGGNTTVTVILAVRRTFQLFLASLLQLHFFVPGMSDS